MPLTFRPAVTADCAALHALHRRAVTVTAARVYPPAVIAAWLGDRTPDRFVGAIASGVFEIAEVEGAAAGYCLRVADEVVSLYVDPGFGRRGVGRALIGRAEAAARAEGAVRMALEATLAGEPFYRTCGYAEVTRYVKPLRDLVTMEVVWMEKALRPAGR